MNSKNMSLAISLIIASFVLVAVNGLSTVQAAQFSQYGSIGQEDQLFVQDSNGIYWVNTGDKYGTGQGQFEAINEINDNFTIDGAIKVFGIYEDTEQFIYEPVLSNGEYSNVLFMYELVGFNHFQLKAVYEDQSGINQELTELENNQ